MKDAFFWRGVRDRQEQAGGGIVSIFERRFLLTIQRRLAKYMEMFVCRRFLGRPHFANLAEIGGKEAFGA